MQCARTLHGTPTTGSSARVTVQVARTASGAAARTVLRRPYYVSAAPLGTHVRAFAYHRMPTLATIYQHTACVAARLGASRTRAAPFCMACAAYTCGGGHCIAPRSGGCYPNPIFRQCHY